MKKKYLIIPFFAVLLTLYALLWRDPAPYRQISGFAWGTTYSITYQSKDDLSAMIAQAIDDINASLSPFNPRSTISAINIGRSMATDSMVADVFSMSQNIYIASGGAFDPTVAPLINLWGFGYEAGMAVPDSASIDSALQCVGIMQCAIDGNGMMLKKSPGTQFNFSAIAKGYGVDHVANMLRTAKCKNFMIEIGGEIALAGRNSHGKDWRIQIDAPTPMQQNGALHERLDVISATNCCIATSGNYRNYRQLSDGTIAAHTISPSTGRPVFSHTLSATIVADRCALADAIATACMAMPQEQAIAMADSLGIAAMLVIDTPDGMQTLTSNKWTY